MQLEGGRGEGVGVQLGGVGGRERRSTTTSAKC